MTPAQDATALADRLELHARAAAIASYDTAAIDMRAAAIVLRATPQTPDAALADDPDGTNLCDVLAQFTNYVMNERVRCYNEGVDDERSRATSQTPDAVRNWTEDASHENGNYECRCVECGRMFIGHKRRVLCKACSGLLTPSASAQAEVVKPMAYWFEHPKFGMELSIDQLSERGRENGWTEIPLYAHPQPQQADGRGAVIEDEQRRARESLPGSEGLALSTKSD